MKRNVFLKFLSLTLALIMALLVFPACDGENEGDNGNGGGDDEGFNPYPYDDLSVYMEVPDYKNFTVKRGDLDRIVKGELMSFCMKNKLTKTLYEGQVQSFDYVNLAFNGKIDGQTFEGGWADSYDLLIGSGSFIDGFEDGMIGMEVGETRDLMLKFPDDYYEAFAGKDVVFTVTVHSITRMDELTDDACKQNSIYDTKEEFMQALTEVCLFDYEWQMLMSKCTLKGYPKEYTEYYQYFYEYFEGEAQASQMELEAFLSVYGGYYSNYGLWRGITLAEFRSVCENYAKSNTVYDLLTYSIMRLENIQLEGDEWEAAKKELEAEYNMTYDKIVEAVGENTAIISILNIRIAKILTSYAMITD